MFSELSSLSCVAGPDLSRSLLFVPASTFIWCLYFGSADLKPFAVQHGDLSKCTPKAKLSVLSQCWNPPIRYPYEGGIQGQRKKHTDSEGKAAKSLQKPRSMHLAGITSNPVSFVGADPVFKSCI